MFNFECVDLADENDGFIEINNLKKKKGIFEWIKFSYKISYSLWLQSYSIKINITIYFKNLIVEL